MPAHAYKVHGLSVYSCNAEGPQLGTERDAADIIGESYDQRPDWILIPASRFGDEFFDLKTQIAGHFVQKFVTYGCRLAIVGDLSRHTNVSKALQDFVLEANRGKQVWFYESQRAFEDRLGKDAH